MDTVVQLAIAVLGIQDGQLNPDRSFSELGVSSLLAVRLLDRINRAFGLRLGVEALFNHGDSRRLAAHVESLLGRTGQEQSQVGVDGHTGSSQLQALASGLAIADAVAVIGYAGKFASAADPEALWQALLEQSPLLSEMPLLRRRELQSKPPCAGFMADAERFDAAFFGLSPREAAAMDPVQRHFLEQAWRGLEHAGLTRAALAGKTVGVYAGAAGSGYDRTLPVTGKAVDAYVMTGNLPSMTAARLAYFLDLHGPAVTVDTACSSSLMAVHLACQALLSGEVDIAIAGGASLFVDERPFQAMARAGMTSSVGACRPFDDRADGIAVAEAAACVILKPLARALADGDRVDAVIRASAANQDGRSNGITAPSALAQAQLLRAALQKAGVNPETIDLVETHGTGTRLGDPIEAAALREVYGKRSTGRPLRVAALKACIGHASEAAGIGGLIAAILSMRHKVFPPIVGFATLNAHLSGAQESYSALEFSGQAAVWPEPCGHPRRAAVSSFGLSGTNVHLILEEAPALAVLPEADGAAGLARDYSPLFLLSAATRGDLDRRRFTLAGWLEGQPESVLTELSSTLLWHREPMTCRWGTRAGSIAELQRKLTEAECVVDDPSLALWLDGQNPTMDGLPQTRRPPLAVPSYSFRGPRLWGGRTLPESAEAAGSAHPLLGATLPDGGFLRLFRADEALVADHTVGGQALLHAAVLLEMSVAAQDRLAPGAMLTHLSWRKPLEIAAATPVRIGIENNLLSISTVGTVYFTAQVAYASPLPIPGDLDVESLWQGLPASIQSTHSGSGRVFLGPSFPGPDRIRADGAQALAFIQQAPAQGLILPPALLDAAIRTAAAAVAAAESDGPQLRFPARLERLLSLAKLPEQGFWLHARRRAEGVARAVESVDVAVYNCQGKALLRLDGLMLAAASEPCSETRHRQAMPKAEAFSDALSWRVVWREILTPAQAYSKEEADLILADADDALADRLCQAFPEARRLGFAEWDTDLVRVLNKLPSRAKIWFLDASSTDRTTALLRLVQALAGQGLSDAGLSLRIITRGALAVLPGEMPLHTSSAAMLGLGKAASREFPAWRVRLIDCGPGLDADASLLERLLGEPGDSLGEPIALRPGLRLAQRLEPLTDKGDAVPIQLTSNAHVIIVGGAGRLGRLVARHLARQYGARLSLIGRSAIDAGRLRLLDEIEDLGGHARYYTADMTDRLALEAALDAALTEFGPATLLIQAAVDPAFARIERTVLAEFESALAPKIAGLQQLGDVWANRPIAALAVFSSIGAFTGFPANDGQSSYCAACNFEASHAQMLMQRLQKPVRIIHWGFWDSGDYPPDVLARMRATGLYPMHIDGIGKALETLLREPHAQLVHARLAAGAWLDLGLPHNRLAHFDAPLAETACSAITAADMATGDESGLDRAKAALQDRIGAGVAYILSARGFITSELITESEALRRLAVLPRHRLLARALLNIAVRHGLVQRDGGQIRCNAITSPQAPQTEEPNTLDLPGMRPAFRLLERCLEALPKVLAGEQPGTEVLFPQGSMDWVEPIYRDQPVLADCGLRLAAAVVAAVAQGGGRILEIGAGTGSTTGPVLDALRAAGLEQHCEYLYSDVSKAFVRHGLARFGGRIDAAGVLDISRPPQEQGIAMGAWDVVIASNVLHATPNIRATLCHVAGLMAPGGIALINEMVESDDFATLTFGLLDGWWEAEDPECRLADGPLLSIEGWRESLRCAGLQGRWAYARHGLPERSDGGQALLLAYKPVASVFGNAVELSAKIPSPHGGGLGWGQTKSEALQLTDGPHPNPPTASAFAPHSGSVETVLRECLSVILDTPAAKLERDRPFMEIGVDSLIAPQIAEEVQAKLGCPLRVTDIYKHGNLAALAAHLLAAYPGRLQLPIAAEVAEAESSGTAEVVATEPCQTGKSPDAIAIIGLSARFAGAADLDALWKLLDKACHAITPISRFDIEPWFDPEGGPDKTYARWGGFLDDYDRFDPYFFNITPVEAEAMDPQQRVLMEEAWKALENAGLNPESLSGSRCGLFIGASANNYRAQGSPGLLALGNSMAILAARMAYVLNLHGPNFPIDTGCSSSLVAMHLACQSLRSGECDLAMAGGVSVNLLSPDIFLYLADAGMASRSGASRTFDDSADGFVPGEGAGMVVLKRLADALADGDRIDAVILGSGINQDGRTAGLTAPSAEAQTALAMDIYRRHGLNPAEFGMIEAHGTGTRLGDPIEVHALTEAFRQYTDRRGGCAIGSIKTNIGHTMAAAGMAGIAKAVLALRHRRIPATLNFTTANRHIDFADSPFFVPTETVPWPEGRALKAAVSSFGFSGTNAHIVLEAGMSGELDQPAEQGPWLFAVSARDAVALKRRLLDLADWLRCAGQGADLSRVAETLARGRAHWRYRRALLAADRTELLTALEQAAGATPPHPIPLDHIPASVTGENHAAGLRHLANAYQSGDMPDWDALFDRRRPPLALPVYPFVRERFWTMAQAATEQQAYPVTSEHLLLAAHRVGGTHILPGTVSLELLRGEAAAIADVTWLRPLTAADTPTRLTVVGDSTVELLTANHSVLARGRREAYAGIATAMPDFTGQTRLDGAELYARFNRSGFDYGAALRVVEWVEIGAGVALSRLVPTQGLAGNPLLLSAALLDGALQTAAAIGYGGNVRTSAEKWVPHHLGALRVWHRPVDACFAQARMEPGLDSDRLVFNVILHDGKGKLFAAFEGMEAHRMAIASTKLTQQVYVPVWLSTPLAKHLPAPAAIALAGADARLETALRERFPEALWLTVDPDGGPQRLAEELAALPSPLLVLHRLAERPAPQERPLTVMNGIASLDPLPEVRDALQLTRALLLARRPEGARLLTVANGTLAHPARMAAFAIAGMYRTLRLEAPNLDVRVLLNESAAELGATLIREILSGPGDDPLFRYDVSLTRQTADWSPMEWLPPSSRLPTGTGTVVISGGLGGIGLALGQRLALAGAASIALLSRSSPDAAAQTAIKAMEGAGAAVLTLAADVGDPRSLAAALRSVRDSLGPITAVYHLAGRLRDGFLLNKQVKELDEVFAAKVRGALLLDLLTWEDPIEAFLLFGSTAAAFGSIGQADYGAANAFLAAFAGYRQNRAGKTLCVDWPLWSIGGMRPSAEAVAFLDGIGMAPLPADLGFDLLAQILATDATTALALHGRTGLFDRLRPFATVRPIQESDDTLAPGASFNYLCELLATISKLPRTRIEPDIPFEELGIDSIAIMKLNRQMETDLGPVAKTLFFEYRTPGALSAHLAKVKAQELATLLRLGAANIQGLSTLPPNTVDSHLPPQGERMEQGRSGEKAMRTDAIAIVGIAGLYPKSPTLERFWENLQQGRDCVQEIPPERWPLQGFYDPDRNRPATSYCKWGGFITDAECFDARFFGISPLEAETLDPQARKFLEVCWNALEDAGLDPDRMFNGLTEPERTRRNGGVFVGVMYGDYQLFGPEEAQKGNLIGPNADYWNIANRVSAFLDLHGPSMAVDTACSSSLSAIHLACQAIRVGDCSMAIAGGVNLCLHPRRHWILSKAGMAASDGRCRSFGAGGDGYVPGEGIGAVVLKPLHQAKIDGDRILGIILGSALNHGGRTSGYTVPNPVAQGEAVSQALQRAGIDPRSISYIEAHGTGTPLGDPIEIRGLARAFADAMPENCAIGSIKANIGHLESAAGIAGLTKVLLQMREQTLTPTLHAEQPNPDLDFTGTGFRIVTRREAWLSPSDTPLRAGISSFGAGGANAHLIVEAAEKLEPIAENPDSLQVLLLSARDGEALRRRADQIAGHLLSEAGRRQTLGDIAHTLAQGRKPFDQRLAVLGATRGELVAALRSFADGSGPATGICTGQARKNAPPVASSDPSVIAANWAEGAPPPHLPGRRVALPGYPFAKRPLWVRLTGHHLAASPSTAHRFLTGQAPLADHKIGGRLLLPGASSLLLALNGAPSPFLRGIVWPAAGLASDGKVLDVRVSCDGERITLHASDGACLLQAHTTAPEEPPTQPDLEALATMCGQVLEAPDIYAALALAGAEYGPSLRVLEQVRFGNGVCLARLRPDASVEAVLDAAFQLCFTLIPSQFSGLALLPAGIGRIAVLAGLETVCTVVAVRRAQDECGITVDFHLLDGYGLTVAWITDFQARAAATGQLAAPDQDEPPLRLLRPEWKPIQPATETWMPQNAWVLSELADDPLALALARAWRAALGSLSTIPAGSPEAVAIVLGAVSGGIGAAAKRAGCLLEALLERLRSWSIEARPPALLLITRDAYSERPLGAGGPGAAAAAFLRACARERQDWIAVTLDLPAAIWDESALGLPLPSAILNALPSTTGKETVPPERIWRDGLLLQRVLAPVALPTSAPPWRDGDVLFIAGSGGLGGLLARRAAACAKVSVALLGRSPNPNRASTQAMEAIQALGRPVLYVQADLADSAALANAVQLATAKLGPITWVVHTALVMGDAPLAQLTPETLHRVLAPKSLGLANLLETVRPTRGLLLFSSSNALTANPGQAAYAAASAFVDAASLNLPYPVHVFDWGFWGETGAVADSAHQAQLARIGVMPIRDREGLAALEQAIGAGLPRVAVLRVSERLLAPLGIDLSRAVRWRVGEANSAWSTSAVQTAKACQQAALAFAEPAIDILNAYAARRLWLALAELGVSTPAGQMLDGTGLTHALSAKPDYVPLMDALAELLQRAGLLDGDSRSTGAAATAAELALERSRLEAEAPATAPTLALLETCMQALGDIVAGRREAGEVLFQGGDAAVAALYQGNPVVDHFQQLTAAAVAGAVQAMRECSAQQPSSLLEVGAGTGSTSGFVLDALDGLDGWHYRITDLAASLVTATAERLTRNRTRLDAGRLDVNLAFGPQGVEPGSVDVLIAANVLHATPDLFAVLANIKEALSPGGLLVLNEATSQQDINTLTFGLTPGWWAFRDGLRRCPHGPLLDPARWDAILAEAGFSVAARFGLPLAQGGEHPLQSVIIAVADNFAPDPARRDYAIQLTPAPNRGGVSKSGVALNDGLSDLEHSLRSLIAETLRLDSEELGFDDSFAEHGADSILSVELVRRINTAYGIDLKSTALFNYATVRELAGHMAREHGAATAPPSSETETDEGKQRVRRLHEVIGRRREAAPVNREAEFWHRETAQDAKEMGNPLPQGEGRVRADGQYSTASPPSPANAAEIRPEIHFPHGGGLGWGQTKSKPSQLIDGTHSTVLPSPADLDEVLRRLECGELSVAQALELITDE